MLLKVS